MNKLLKEWRIVTIVIVVMAVFASCSVGDDADSPDANMKDSYNAISKEVFLYEGEWTVNKQIVDTARLVVNEAIQIRLPESYLLSLCFNHETVTTAPSDYNPITIRLLTQGYSDQSLYLVFSSVTAQTPDNQLLFNTCSFEASVNGTPYSISLLSKENASAIYRNGTGQWTLAIPVSAFLITDLSTGTSDTRELPVTTMIYYNTKQRIN
jgi:hypothetical protein